MDYDSIIEKLKNTENLPTYDLLIALEKIILKNDIEILIHELAVFLGLSLRFVYSYENPSIYEDFSYFAFNLKKYLNFQLNFLNVDAIKDVELPFVLSPGNCLVIERTEDTLICEHGFDRFKLSVGGFDENVRILKLNVSKIERKDLYQQSIFRDIAYEIHHNYYDGNKDSLNYFVGKNAFKMFIKDLGDNSKTFHDMSSLILTETIQNQMTALYGLKVYLLGIYHFLSKDEQKILFEGIEALGDSIMFFREFERISKDALMRNMFNSEIRRRCVNSLKRMVASFEHFVYILEKFI
ncbi:hypothetical protein [Caldisericum sp.]